MALTIHYDTSGHEANSLFVSCVGVVAPAERWAEFDRDWKAVLDQEGVKEFHHTDFKGSQGEFLGWEEPQRRRLMGGLLDVLDRYLVQWHSSGIYPRSFSSVAVDYDLDPLAGPFMLSAASAQILVQEWAAVAVPGEPLLHIFEKGDHGQKPGRRLEDLGGDVVVLDKYEKSRGYIYGFQAADLIAGELTTLQAGLSVDVDEFNRIGRYPLERVFAIPGRIVNNDALALRAMCRQFPHLFPPRL